MRLLCAIGTAGWLAAQIAAPPDSLLRAGSVVERTFDSTAPHTYRVELAPREFLLVVVEQHAVDVALRLIDPAGALVSLSDSANGAFGFERVAFVAPAAGVYVLEVRPPSTMSSGSYTLEVRAIRPATPEDATHEAAEHAFRDAEAARSGATPETRAKAVAKYQEAAKAFQSLHLDYEYALAQFTSGITHLSGGETRAAVADLMAVLPIVQQRKDQLLPSVLNALGGASDIVGELDRAMTFYGDALAFFRADGNKNGETSALNNIGKLHADMADWQRALDYYRQALLLVRAQRNVRVEGLVLMNIGVAYDRLGDPSQALDFFEQALGPRRASRDKGGEADTLDQMAVSETHRGDLPKALSYYDQALSLRREVGNRPREAVTLNDLGRTYLALDQTDRARAAFDEALPLNRAGGDRRNEALTLGNLAGVQAALGRHDDALALARQALGILREIGDRNNVAGMLNRIAQSERDTGQLPDAARDAAAGLDEIEAVRGRVVSTDLRATYLARQHDAFTFYIDLLMRQHDREPGAGFDRRALEASERARARSFLDTLVESGARIARGADPALLERERRVGQEINAKADRLMRFAGRAPAPPEAVALAREIRALQSEYDEVREALRRTSPAYASLTQPQPLDATAIQRRVLDANTVLLQYALGPDASYLWVVDLERITSVRLPAEATIVGAVRDVHDRVTGPRGPAPSVALRKAIARLSAMVLPPEVLPALGKRLVIVPDGALEYVPFSMLTVRPRTGAAAVRLIQRGEIVTLPSASALAAQRVQLAGRARPANGIAVLADPVFDLKDARASKVPVASTVPPLDAAQDLSRILAHLSIGPGGIVGSIPRLPFTQREATSIIRAGGEAKHLEAVGFDATKELVLGGSLRDYRFVHFATHGFVDAERPALSAIVLSLIDRDGKPRDGFLRAHELYNLDLAADLVVLSACETGLGRQVRGEGVVGLTRAFMYAGAARVVVSLWSVSDRATAALMRVFYREMLEGGKTPAAALRAAQLAMMKQPGWDNPYYWAAFIIAGDWRESADQLIAKQ